MISNTELPEFTESNLKSGRIKQVLIADAIQQAAVTELREEGIELFSHLAEPHRMELRTMQEEAKFETAAKTWLAETDHRCFLDPDDFYYNVIDFCIQNKIPHSGGNKAMKMLEYNRRFARSVMASSGFEMTSSISVNTIRDKERVIEQARREYEECGRLYVIKADYNVAKDWWLYFNVFVPETWDDFLWAMEKYDAPLSLEERMTGIEIAFTVFVVGGEYIVPLHTNFEHKRTHAGNLGVNAGEMGTLIIRDIAPMPLAKIFDPLRPFLLKEKYTGYLDLNCIYNPATNVLAPLEFTPRWGTPTHMCYSEIIERPGRLMLEWSCGNPIKPKYTGNASVCVLVVAGGFPFPQACLQDVPAVFTRPLENSRWTTINLKPDPEWGYIVKQGRQGVLASGALTVEKARKQLYYDAESLEFEEKHIRMDIGERWGDEKQVLLDAGLITAEQYEY